MYYVYRLYLVCHVIIIVSMCDCHVLINVLLTYLLTYLLNHSATLSENVESQQSFLSSKRATFVP